MNGKPVLSIIIPAYNEEKYINACLTSIFHQKWDQPFEVIVVDNNSHDKTAEITLAWKKVKLVTEIRPGATVARNRGATEAQADILYFLDADCRLFPEVLEKMAKVFVHNSSCQLVSGPYIYDDGGFLPKLATDTLCYFSLFHFIVKLCSGVSQFPGGNFAIRKELFDRVGGFDETICNQEIILPDDLDLAIRLQKGQKLNMLFSRKFAVYSSFRRVKRSPIKDTLVRFFATVKMLVRRN